MQALVALNNWWDEQNEKLTRWKNRNINARVATLSQKIEESDKRFGTLASLRSLDKIGMPEEGRPDSRGLSICGGFTTILVKIAILILIIITIQIFFRFDKQWISGDPSVFNYAKNSSTATVLDLPAFRLQVVNTLTFFEAGTSSLQSISVEDGDGSLWKSSTSSIPRATSAYSSNAVPLGSTCFTLDLQKLRSENQADKFDSSLRALLTPELQSFFPHNFDVYVRFDDEQLAQIKKCQLQLSVVNAAEYEGLRKLYPSADCNSLPYPAGNTTFATIPSTWKFDSRQCKKGREQFCWNMLKFSATMDQNLYNILNTQYPNQEPMNWKLMINFVNNFRRQATDVTCGTVPASTISKSGWFGATKNATTFSGLVLESVWPNPSDLVGRQLVWHGSDNAVYRLGITAVGTTTATTTAVAVRSLSQYSSPLPKAPPSTWACSPSYYGADDGCDCECGAPDPDCDRVTEFPYVYGCHDPGLSRCSAEGHCTYSLPYCGGDFVCQYCTYYAAPNDPYCLGFVPYGPTGSGVDLTTKGAVLLCSSVIFPGEYFTEGVSGLKTSGVQRDFNGTCDVCPFDCLEDNKPNVDENQRTVCQIERYGYLEAANQATRLAEILTPPLVSTYVNCSSLFPALVNNGGTVTCDITATNQEQFNALKGLGFGTCEVDGTNCTDIHNLCRSMDLRVSGKGFPLQSFIGQPLRISKGQGNEAVGRLMKIEETNQTTGVQRVWVSMTKNLKLPNDTYFPQVCSAIVSGAVIAGDFELGVLMGDPDPQAPCFPQKGPYPLLLSYRKPKYATPAYYYGGGDIGGGGDGGGGGDYGYYGGGDPYASEATPPLFSETPVPGGDTPTETPVPGGDTPTETPVPGGDTPTQTPVPGGDTPTQTPVPGGDTPTQTPVPGGDTPTQTPVPAGDTPTQTPVPADTPTQTPVPAVQTATQTPVPAVQTATQTPVPAVQTATQTPVPAVQTATQTPAKRRGLDVEVDKASEVVEPNLAFDLWESELNQPPFRPAPRHLRDQKPVISKNAILLADLMLGIPNKLPESHSLHQELKEQRQLFGQYKARLAQKNRRLAVKSSPSTESAHLTGPQRSGVYHKELASEDSHLHKLLEKIHGKKLESGTLENPSKKIKTYSKKFARSAFDSFGSMNVQPVAPPPDPNGNLPGSADEYGTVELVVDHAKRPSRIVQLTFPFNHGSSNLRSANNASIDNYQSLVMKEALPRIPLLTPWGTLSVNDFTNITLRELRVRTWSTVSFKSFLALQGGYFTVISPSSYDVEVLIVTNVTSLDTIPSGWTCSKSYYNAKDGCDCDCGAYDPDCSIPTPGTYSGPLYCSGGYYYCINGVCDGNYACSQTATCEVGPDMNFEGGDPWDRGVEILHFSKPIPAFLDFNRVITGLPNKLDQLSYVSSEWKVEHDRLYAPYQPADRSKPQSCEPWQTPASLDLNFGFFLYPIKKDVNSALSPICNAENAVLTKDPHINPKNALVVNNCTFTELRGKTNCSSTTRDHLRDIFDTDTDTKCLDEMPPTSQFVYVQSTPVNQKYRDIDEILLRTASKQYVTTYTNNFVFTHDSDANTADSVFRGGRPAKGDRIETCNADRSNCTCTVRRFSGSVEYQGLGNAVARPPDLPANLPLYYFQMSLIADFDATKKLAADQDTWPTGADLETLLKRFETHVSNFDAASVGGSTKRQGLPIAPGLEFSVKAFLDLSPRYSLDLLDNLVIEGWDVAISSSSVSVRPLDYNDRYDCRVKYEIQFAEGSRQTINQPEMTIKQMIDGIGASLAFAAMGFVILETWQNWGGYIGEEKKWVYPYDEPAAPADGTEMKAVASNA